MEMKVYQFPHLERMIGKIKFLFWVLISSCIWTAKAQHKQAGANVVWSSQSESAAGSMPCGGGDIGLNVWVEKGELLFYIARSGTFDENNTLLKLGRVRLKLSPNPFDAGSSFKQELVLKEGYVKVTGIKGGLQTEVKVWVDVFKPIVHLELKSNQKTFAEAGFESWRNEDRLTK